MAPDHNRAEAVVERFAPLFAPQSIAVVGASSKNVAQGNLFIRNLREAGYTGAIYPIHPTEPGIEGLATFASFSDVPEPIDYAFIAVAAERVPPLLAAADGRVRYAQVMSSGFGETPEGAELEKSLVDAARRGGVRVLGPNCMGTYSPRGHMSFVAGGVDAPGTIGILSQSGGLSIDLLRIGRSRGLRYSGVVSLGNCADLGVNDLLEYFLADPGTRVIGAYLEHVREGRRLFDQLREANAKKPVVILKGGRTRQGQRAAASHTGSLATGDEAWQALAKQTGSILVDSIGQLIDVLAAFQAWSPRTLPPNGRVVLFGNGGGASVLGTDALARLGLDVAPLEPPTINALAALELAAGASIANPIDVPANILQREHGALARRIIEAVAANESPEAILVHLNIPVLLSYRHLDLLGELMTNALQAQAGAAFHGRTHLMLALRANGDPDSEAKKREWSMRATEAGVSVMGEISDAAYALAALHAYDQFRYSRGVTAPQSGVDHASANAGPVAR